MKKILTSIALLGALSFTASAQKACDLKLEGTPTLTSVPYGDTSRISFKLTNNGTAAMAVTDTVFYGVVGSNSVFRLRLTSAIPSGSSANFANQLFLANDSAMAVDMVQDFCFVLYNQSDITVGGVPFPVTYVDNNAVNDTTCMTITLKKSSTGLFDVNGGAKVTLKSYPNPTANTVSFKYNFSNTAASVRITDIAGRVVMTKDFGKQSGEKELSLDVSSLTNGMYYLELIADDKRAISKITVQK